MIKIHYNLFLIESIGFFLFKKAEPPLIAPFSRNNTQLHNPILEQEGLKSPTTETLQWQNPL